MSSPLLPETLRTELKELIREILREEVNGHGMPPPEKDRLMRPEELAQILDQNIRWVYRHAPQWTFTRRLSRKCLRFSEAGLRRWIAAKKPLSLR